MTLESTQPLRSFFRALFEPQNDQAITAEDDLTPATKTDDDEKQPSRDESFFWGWSMYGHW